VSCRSDRDTGNSDDSAATATFQHRVHEIDPPFDGLTSDPDTVETGIAYGVSVTKDLHSNHRDECG
jgi:hypothetical protein